MSATEAQEREPPRQEADLYGEAVLEHGTGAEYWEGYVPDQGDVSDDRDRLMIAKYIWQDGEWVKTGLEMAHITEVHQNAWTRRKKGE